MIIAQSVVYNVTDEIIGVEGDVEHMRVNVLQHMKVLDT